MYGKYSTEKAEIDREIEEITKRYSTPATQELFRQMFTTVIKLHLDNADIFDLRLINASLKELRHSFRIFHNYRGIPKVTIWGSARVKPDTKEYQMALEFARTISKKGYMVITGGGGGVMEAGNCGGGNKSFAINISLPNMQKPNPFVIKGEKLIEFKYFFDRKLMFVKESNATVLFPGGFGTNDEAFEILTLYQTGKSVPRPIIMIEPPGSTYWRSWLNFIKKEMIGGGFLPEEDLNLFTIVASAKKAAAEILDFYRVYNSIRFIGPTTIIRLNKKLPDFFIKRLNKDFADILTGGKIGACEPTAEEIKDKDLVKLPRLSMHFDRHRYGKLNLMIKKINES